MESAIQIFNNPNFGELRTLNEDGNILFCASDAAKILGYEKPNNAINQHCRYTLKRGIPHPQNADKTIEMNFIPESDLYRLIVHSQLEGAQKFEAWVFEEVLPSIRKTGSYSLAKTSGINEKLMLAAKVVLESAGITGNQCALSLDKLFKRYEGISALEAMEVELRAPEQEQLLTPSEIGKHFGLNGRRVNEILAGLGWQHKINKSWEAIGDGVNYSVMLDVGKRYADGVPVRQLKWKTSVIDAVKARV